VVRDHGGDVVTQTTNGVGGIITTTDTQALLQYHVGEMLKVLGYDLEDQHFEKTPERVARVLSDFGPKRDADVALHLLDAQFDDEHDSLVLVGPISVTSMCAHHMLPVTGWAWIGYIPEKKVCGLSKMSRVAQYWAKQYTVQERVTQQIANTMMTGLNPQGVMVVIQQEHGCMSIRGVEEPQAVTTTSAVRGIFKTNQGNCKDEFLKLMHRPS
jgi:GTP cyclohydrolase IA